MAEPSPIGSIVAVVLAGGFGTRIKHLLPDLPKPMAPVCDRPFVEWVLRYLRRQGIDEAVLSTGYLGEAIETYFATQPIPDMKVSCFRETEPLGTAGGFLHAVERSRARPDAWLVTNGDSLVCTDLAPMAAHLADPLVDGVILGVPVADASRYGSLVCDRESILVNFAEKQPGSGVINGGVYLLRHRLLAQFPIARPLGFEQDVFPRLLESGARLRVEPVDAPFLDIGTPESLPQAETFIRYNRDRFGR